MRVRRLFIFLVLLPTAVLSMTAPAAAQCGAAHFVRSCDSPPGGGDGAGDTPVDVAPQDPAATPLTWAPPAGWESYQEVRIDADGGFYGLDANTDYRLVAPETIRGGVHIQGGRNVVWIGGHISIPHQGPGPVSIKSRRALYVQDHKTASVERTVHIEGLLIDGEDLAEGIDVAAPTAVVQLQNIHVAGVHFRNSDDRDGTAGWEHKNHPDIIQTFGSQRELRIDGLTGSSSYQGIFLKEDSDAQLGPTYLRRVDLTAMETPDDADPAISHAGGWMLAWHQDRSGRLHVDQGTVWVRHHERAITQPGGTWRNRFRTEDGTVAFHLAPAGATFVDAIGYRKTTAGTDEVGTFAHYPDGDPQFRSFDGGAGGRVYSGAAPTPTGQYVPADSVGTGYQPPGYVAS